MSIYALKPRFQQLLRPAVRALLSSEVGTRAAEGHIGRVNRWFAGTKHIDEVESLCRILVESKRLRVANWDRSVV